MTGSTLSVFGDAEDYEAALRAVCGVDLLVTGRGPFHARVTRIVLERMQLLAAEETLARIAFLTLPPDGLRVSLPVAAGTVLVSGGTPARPGEIVTHAGGGRVHERTRGPTRWGSIWLPLDDLLRCGRAMIGPAFTVPRGTCRWRPPAAALHHLVELHADAMRATRLRPRLPAGAEAARGLEQLLLQALAECMAPAVMDPAAAAEKRQASIMERFEDLIRADPCGVQPIGAICAAIGVPDRTLRTCCESHLGLSPLRYLQLRRMQLARHALRGALPGGASVAQIARLHGFGQPGRFAGVYRAQFGELPSATLRHRGRAGLAG